MEHVGALHKLGGSTFVVEIFMILLLLLLLSHTNVVFNKPRAEI